MTYRPITPEGNFALANAIHIHIINLPGNLTTFNCFSFVHHHKVVFALFVEKEKFPDV